MQSIHKKINVINIGSRALNAKPSVLTEKWIVKQSMRSIPPIRFKREAAVSSQTSCSSVQKADRTEPVD